MQELFGQEDVPDLYVDSVRLAVGPYGFVLDLGVQGLPDTPMSETPPVKRVAVVRMSPQHALVLARILAKNVRIYEEQIGKISLPGKMFEDLGIESE
jgi:hypothetical protein